jgi:hypothetical protein
MICIVNDCNFNIFLKDMCYKHHLLKVRITTYYHKIGDPLLKDDYNLLPSETELYKYNKDKIYEIIYNLFDKIGKWRKCLYARKEIEKLYSSKDYGHENFMKIIYQNVMFF